MSGCCGVVGLRGEGKGKGGGVGGGGVGADRNEELEERD